MAEAAAASTTLHLVASDGDKESEESLSAWSSLLFFF